jgi:RNA:NAD 2'-phosphotransferase (TPT1/KptA family)
MDAITALALLNQLAQTLATLAALIQRAQAEGRAITSDELDALAAGDDLARAALESAIARARAEGR